MAMFCTSANAPVGDQNLTASTRMDMAVERGEALSVVLFLILFYSFTVLFCHLFTDFFSLYIQAASEYEAPS
jgi:HUS1 checkpoint protein